MPDTEGSFGNSGQTPRSALMRKKTAFLLLAFAVSAASLVAQTRTARTTLDIYVVDVEGGNSVLFVAPSGESSSSTRERGSKRRS